MVEDNKKPKKPGEPKRVHDTRFSLVDSVEPDLREQLEKYKNKLPDQSKIKPDK